MKKVIGFILILISANLSFAGNGGGVGLTKVSYVSNDNFNEQYQTNYAIRIIDIKENGVLVEIESNEKTIKTFLTYEILESAKPELIQALVMSIDRPNRWVEL